VAHDFNNLLQLVTSGAALLKRPAVPEAKRAEILNGMIQAGKNARELTGRLLAFARQQALRPETIDVGARLAAMSDLLRQTFGSRIQVETDIEAGLWPVCADASQHEVAILNLAVNARDAIEYVCIAIKDTDAGIPAHIRTRIHEPFFTTKAARGGTGLGPPRVHGFARQLGGGLLVESEPGQGTTVFFHLPRASTAAAAGRSGASRTDG
jgi:signal transduction histidine kinase